MKNIAITAILLIGAGFLTGCATGRFTHMATNAEDEVISETSLTYVRIGKQELTGLRGEAPNGWLFSLQKQESQKVDIDELIDEVVNLMEQRKLNDGYQQPENL